MTIMGQSPSFLSGVESPPNADKLDRRDAMVFLILLIGLCAVYCSALIMPYAYLDDYFWLDLAKNSPSDLYGPQIVQGRPLNALILEGVFRAVGTIGHLRMVRALTVVQMAGMGWMFYWAMKLGGFDRRAAMMIAAMACVVPAMQVYAAWADSVGIPLSGIAACGAALLTRRALDDVRRHWALLLVAAALMLISATIYQPTAMVFWPIAAIDLFRPGQSRGRWRRFLIYLIVAAAGLFLAWCAFKYGLSHIAKRPSPKRAGMTHDPVGKFFWFFHHPLVDSLNLFWLRPNFPGAIGMGAFLIGGLLLFFSGDLRCRLMNLALAAILLPLSYLPNLLAEESWSSYRTQIGLSWTVLILTGLALQGVWPKKRGVVRIILGVVCIGAAVAAAIQVELFFARPQQLELSRLRQELTKVDPTTTQRIIFLQPGAQSRFAPYSRYDEFGRTSMYAFWVPQSAVNLLLGKRIPVELKADFSGNASDWASPGAAIIDMRDVSRNP